MTKTTKLTAQLVALALIVALGVVATTAADRPPKMVGTWIIFLDALPEVPPLLFTFNSDYTFIGSAPAIWASNAHGVWKRVDVRTYESTQLSYVFDADDNFKFLQKSNVRYHLSRDGESCTIEAEVINMRLDGTVVSTNTETDTGYRLNYEPFGQVENPSPLPGLNR